MTLLSHIQLLFDLPFDLPPFRHEGREKSETASRLDVRIIDAFRSQFDGGPRKRRGQGSKPRTLTPSCYQLISWRERIYCIRI